MTEAFDSKAKKILKKNKGVINMNKNNLISDLKNFSLKNLHSRLIAFLSLFIAFTAIATYIRIPGVHAQYYNLGEAAIYTLALVFGSKVGAVAGAAGSAIVDIIVAPIWAPFTFIIKGLEGWIVGKVSQKNNFKKNIIAIIIGGHIMIIGYFLSVWLLYDWPAALMEIAGNYGQAFVGGLIALPLSKQIQKYL